MVSRNYFPARVHGGAQVSVMQLAQGLQARGHAVAVLNVDDHAHRGLHAASGIPEYRLRLRNLYLRGDHPAPTRIGWHLIDRLGDRMAADYRAVLRDFRPDVINTHVMAGIGTTIWRVAAAWGVPVVHRVSDYYLMCLNSGHRKKGANCTGVCRSCRALALAPARRRTPLVRHVIYVSEKIRSIYDCSDVFPRDVPTTILTGAYRPERPVAPRPDLLEPDRLTIGFFGRISPEKGLEQLLTMLRTLPGDSWRLRVGGDGRSDYVNQLKELARDLPVDFLGVQAPDDFYATIDTLVVSSLWDEPSGRVAFESGIHGVIPIVAARGGLPEMVAHGERGLVFDPDAPATLLAAIARVRGDRALRERVRARWLIDRHDYDPDVVAERTLAIYERLVEARL
ncbi:glycosyltransferase [Sphingomonas sp. RHCKR7]|uniref:glycosyltransferase n=1 Tax=Sphingomonas folli TaxID=2862497 RepID=UPI001CA5618B|nr:glycosyltransferase [Sphingomonas folli]MBW6528265.1 glycosyltransferase [Sphingomonas folli]